MPTQVKYKSDAGTVFPAELISVNGREAEIIIEGDPFPVTVKRSQVKEVKNMPTKTGAPTARELRNSAKGLGIEGYQEMSKAELQAAVEAAETAQNGSAPRKRKTGTSKAKTSSKAKSTSKKATPRKTTTKKGSSSTKSKAKTTRKSTTRKTSKAKADVEAKRKAVAEAKRKGQKNKVLPVKHRAGRISEEEQAKIDARENGNPFRGGTNIYYIAEKLIKGGKRQTLINQLKRSNKIEFTEAVRNKAGFDEDKELDHRLRVVGYTLRNEYGFGYVMKGRGRDGHIQVFPPDAEVPEEFADIVEYDKTGGKYDRRK